MKKEIKEKYQIGVDLAYKPSWWKRFLVWLGIKKKDWDYSCMIVSREKDGIRIFEKFQKGR